MKVETRKDARAFVMSLLLLGGPAVAPAAGPQTSGEAIDGLQMAIQLDGANGATSAVPKFKIELHNAGRSDLVLNLGLMLANGKKQYANALVLTLTDAQGKSRQFDLREPAFIAGRVDPFVLPLPVGSTFSIPVDLDDYWAAASKEFDYELKPGIYAIGAQFTGRPLSGSQPRCEGFRVDALLAGYSHLKPLAIRGRGMSFVAEKIETPAQIAEFESFQLKDPFRHLPLDRGPWVVDRARGWYFVNLGGGASEIPWFRSRWEAAGAVKRCGTC